MSNQPWIGGPKELLQHGLGHLQLGSDFDMLIAMISIDNAVELMMKVYLELPRRITGLQITRTKYEEMSKSFTSIVDAMEEYAADKLVGINLGEIEWFHRKRNILYHAGNGITAERALVKTYAGIAQVLLKNLYDVEIKDEEAEGPIDVTDFLLAWRDLEDELTIVAKANKIESATKRQPSVPIFVEILAQRGIVDNDFLQQFEHIRKFRNLLGHGEITPTSDVIEDYYHITENLFEIVETL